MPSLGEELRRAREERGVSLRQISDATHIGVRFLQAIEADNYAILPGGIFNRSFVRSYARYIGIDEEQALARYNQQLEEMGGEPPKSSSARFEAFEEEEPSSWGSISLILLILVILGVGGYGAYRYFKGNAAKGGEPLKSPSAQHAGAPTSSPEASPAAAEAKPLAAIPTPAPTAMSAPPETLRMRIEAHDEECWIKVTTDNNRPEMGILKPGEGRDFVADDKIILNLGRLPAVSVTLNGRPAKIPASGKDGTVAERVVITKDNYQKFIE
jgi:cytoskeletal protein RodZ